MARRGWVILAFGAAGAAALGIGSLLRTEVYESTATVRVDPAWIEGYYGAPDVEPDAHRDLARELAHLRSDIIEDGIETQFEYDMTIEAHRGGENEIVIVGTAADAGLAANIPNTALTTYLDVRAAEAEAHAESAVQFWTGRVEELAEQVADGATPEDGPPFEVQLAEAEAQLDGAETRAANTSDHAEVVDGPTFPDDPISPRPVLAAVLGLTAGLMLGLAVAFLLDGGGVAARVRAGIPVTSVARRDGRPFDRRWLEAPSVAFLLLGALVVGRAAIYAAFGANHILDDWSLVGFRELEGVLDLVPVGQNLTHSRPGAWLTFTLIYGAVGAHPLILLAVMTVLNVALVVVLYLILARFVSGPVSLLVAALWVVLPTHNCLTVWTGTSQVVMSLLLLLLGVLALTHGRYLPAGLALAASILCYELTTPACLLAPLVVGTPVLPLRADAGGRPLTWPHRLVATAMAAAAAIWVSIHSIYPLELRSPSPGDIWTAHFGVGLFGSHDTSNWLVVLTAGLVAGGAAFAVVRWIGGDRGREAGPTLVVAGLAVMAVGLGVAFTIPISPLGFGDRLHAVSSIGSALVLAGVLRTIWVHARVLAASAGAVLVTLALIGQVISLRSWSQAGDDVVAVLRYIDTAFPEPESTHFIVGPELIPRNGVQGASSPYGGAEMAYRLQYPDGTGSLVFANNPDEFVADQGQTLIEWPSALSAGD